MKEKTFPPAWQFQIAVAFDRKKTVFLNLIGIYEAQLKLAQGQKCSRSAYRTRYVVVMP